MNQTEEVITRDIQAIELGIQDAQDAIGRLITRCAQTHHRYNNQTGNLTRSIEYTKVAKNIIKEYINQARAPYGQYIHGGFKSWAPDPFIDEAITACGPQIEQIIADSIDRRLMGVS